MSNKKKELYKFSIETKILRKNIIQAIYKSKKGHIGGALSCLDAIYFLYKEKVVTSNTKKQLNERPFILSKGHSGTALLAVLEKIFKKKLLKNYNINGSLIGNNPSELIKGIEFHTGSLGHGPGLGAGIALGKKILNNKAPVTILISDGELNEGSVWEALQFIVKHELNISILIDNNGQICDNYFDNVSGIKKFKNIFKSLGFQYIEINGNLYYDIKKLKNWNLKNKKPRICVMNTIKGKGVSFMENKIKWHQSIPNNDEMIIAMKELS